MTTRKDAEAMHESHARLSIVWELTNRDLVVRGAERA